MEKKREDDQEKTTTYTPRLAVVNILPYCWARGRTRGGGGRYLPQHGITKYAVTRRAKTAYLIRGVFCYHPRVASRTGDIGS